MNCLRVNLAKKTSIEWSKVLAEKLFSEVYIIIDPLKANLSLKN